MSEVRVYAPKLKDDGLRRALAHLENSGLMSGSDLTLLDVGDLERRWEYDERCIDKHAMLESLKFDRLDSGCRPLFLGGSNSNHHLTYAVCRNLIDQYGRDYTVIQLDKHEDGAVRDPNIIAQTRDERTKNILHCGRFYDKLLADSPHAKAVAMIDEEGNLTLNTDGKIRIVARDYGSYRLLEHSSWFKNGDFSDRIVDMTYVKSDEKFLEKVCSMIPTECVYTSVDMDVLWYDYIHTDWGHGKMELAFLMKSLKKIMESKYCLGADMYGLKSELSQSTFDYFSSDGPHIGDFYARLRKDLDTHEKVFVALREGLSG